nr:unnamed protein product [Digitaria exilis]
MAAPASAATAGSGGGAMSSDNAKGLILAVSSSAFIGASFIVKKMGLRRAADSGVRAGEIANFAAYAFAPAILVTPLGALSIIISAALAHAILQEKLHTFGILGCVLCVVGSITIVLHAPQERDIDSVKEVWDLATEPAFLCYAAIVVAAALVLIYFVVPHHGQTNIMVYIGVCSLLGSLTDWDHQNPTQIVTELCGFMTILSGTFLLHKTKDMADSPGQSVSTPWQKHASQNGFAIEVMPLKCQDSVDDETLMAFPKVDSGYLKEEHTRRYKDSSIV